MSGLRSVAADEAGKLWARGLPRLLVAVLLATTASAAEEPASYLSLDSTPWTKVYEDGEFIGSTPLFKRRIDAGAHSYRLINEGDNIDQTVAVRAHAGKLLVVRVVTQADGPAVSSTERAVTRPSLPSVDEEASTLLQRAIAAYTALQFDEALVVARAVVARRDATVEEQHQAFRLWGIAAAVSMDPTDAELPFRMLLRARPDFDLPSSTAPKVLSVFRKVQQEEQALARSNRDADRARVIAGLRLLGDTPAEAVGGEPLDLTYQLEDPTNAVQSVRASYRRQGEEGFSVLLLTRQRRNLWRGQLVPSLTASEAPYNLEYFVEAVGRDGPLLATGSMENPQRISFSAGLAQVTTPSPWRFPRWVFWTTLGAGIATASVSGGCAVAFSGAQRELYALATSLTSVNFETYSALSHRASGLGTATQVSFIGALTFLVSAGVLAFVTDWGGD